MKQFIRSLVLGFLALLLVLSAVGVVSPPAYARDGALEATTTREPPPPPPLDLVPTTLDGVPSYVTTQQDYLGWGNYGITFPVTWEVEDANAPESLPALEWSVTFVLSYNNDYYDQGDIPVGSAYYNGWDYPDWGGEKWLYMYDVPPGNPQLVMHVEDRTYQEENTSNNDLAVPITIRVPDLAPTDAFLPDTIGDTDIFGADFLVANAGNGYTMVSWFDQLWASVDGVLDGGDRFLGWQDNSDVPAGGSYVDMFDVHFPSIRENGEHYLILRTNAGYNLYEFYDDNNTLVVPLPPVYYNLTITAYEGGTSDPPPGKYLRPAGTQMTIRAIPDAGYDFFTWSGSLGLEQTSPEITVTLDDNTAVNAIFVEQQYTLDLRVNGQGTTDPEPGLYDYPRSSAVSLTAIPDEGWTFVNWTGDLWEITGSANSPTISVAMNWDWTITANFARVGAAPDLVVSEKHEQWTAGAGRYNVFFTVTNVGGSTAAASRAGLQLNGVPQLQRAEVPALAVGESYSGSFPYPVIIGDIPDQVTVIADVDAQVTEANEDNNTRRNTWNIRTYTLTVEVNYGGNTNPAPGPSTYLSGTVVDVSAIADDGWRFLVWTGDAVADPDMASTSIVMDGYKKITANFAREGEDARPDLIVTEKHEEWPIPGSAAYVVSFTVRNLSVQAGASRAGLEIDGVLQDQKVDVPPLGPGGTYVGTFADPILISGAWDAVAVIADVDCQVIEANEDNNELANNLYTPVYTLRVGVNGSGNTAPAVGAHSYYVWTVVNVSAAPAEGWRFVSWTGDVVDPDSPTTAIVMGSNKDVTANFAREGSGPDLIVNAKHEQLGTGTGAYAVSFSITNIGDSQAGASRAGLRIDGMLQTGRVTVPTLDVGASYAGTFAGAILISGAADDVMVIADVDGQVAEANELNNTLINVLHAPVRYALTLAVSGSGSTAPAAGARSYYIGAVVSIEAAPAGGWVFLEWGGDASGSDNPVAVTMDANKIVTAVFIPYGTTPVRDILQNPQDFEGQLVTLSGTYRGWEAGHGSPPVTRSDWVLRDATGFIYVGGASLGLAHPADLGEPVTVTGTVRLKDGRPYLEVKRARGRGG